MYSLDEIKKIAVIGAGVMGHGIALAAARAGFDVVLFDINKASLEKAQLSVTKFLNKSVDLAKLTESQADAIKKSIHYSTDMMHVKGELIIEAVLENIELKHKIFSDLEKRLSEKTIFASNTSTIPITKIAACLDKPERMLGLHFFNPAPIMKLLEIIPGEATSKEAVDIAFKLSEKFAKKAVLTKDEPGFIVNRVARHFYLENQRTAQDQVADFETIDALMKNVGFRMGAFELMDLIGIETNHSVTKSMYEAFFHEARFRPARIQQKKVDAGQFGKKTKQGFYKY